MIRGFTFERALSWPFTAAHAATFPWIFGAAYALVLILMYGVIGLLAAEDFANWFTAMEAADAASDPDEQMELAFGGFARLLPWGLVGSLASWVIWAMFETASQRRYIRDEAFSLGFGADEARMMLVGLLWFLMGLVVIALPLVLTMGGIFYQLLTDPIGFETNANSQQVGLQVLGSFVVLLFVFPLYVFLATRLAPSFGLTVQARKIRFFDAWNVSRGRFWPILGAFVILAVAGNIIGQVLSGIVQTLMTPVLIDLANGVDGDDLRTVVLSPRFLVPMSIYGFVILFLQGLIQHFIGGPAAFAVRHDPRGGVEEQARIGAFD
jgi:hypothetical protein